MIFTSYTFFLSFFLNMHKNDDRRTIFMCQQTRTVRHCLHCVCIHLLAVQHLHNQLMETYAPQSAVGCIKYSQHWGRVCHMVCCHRARGTPSQGGNVLYVTPHPIITTKKNPKNVCINSFSKCIDPKLNENIAEVFQHIQK